MRRTVFRSAAIALLCGAFSAVSAPTADEILSKAREKAAKEGKNIFVDFSASW